MKKSDIDAILDKIDKENSIFKNKAALDVLRTPKHIIGRNNEVESLVRFLASHKQAQFHHLSQYMEEVVLASLHL